MKNAFLSLLASVFVLAAPVMAQPIMDQRSMAAIDDLQNYIVELEATLAMAYAVGCSATLGGCAGAGPCQCSAGARGSCTCSGSGCQEVCTCTDPQGTMICKWVQQGGRYNCHCSSGAMQMSYMAAD